jgi:hypothetical protein
MVTIERTAQGVSALMLTAANDLLVALVRDQRERLLLPFDDIERLNWHFTPVARRGLPLKDMTPWQQALAHALVAAGLSQTGYIQASTIMSLEQVLHDYEPEKRWRRDAALYYFSIFSEPSPNGTWGWRFEGHHVSLNFTLIDGTLRAAAPTFFGANPVQVQEGPRRGTRVLGAREDRARELIRSLDSHQQSVAIVDSKAPIDLPTYNAALLDPTKPLGIQVSGLTSGQQRLLAGLLQEYINTMPDIVASERAAAVAECAADDLHFAWAGGTEPGEPHYYAIQSPSFFVEYDNTQDGANHIHSVWHDYRADFGRDVLGIHYREEHHGPRQVLRPAQRPGTSSHGCFGVILR